MTRTPRDKANQRDKEVPRATEAYVAVIRRPKMRQEIQVKLQSMNYLACHPSSDMQYQADYRGSTYTVHLIISTIINFSNLRGVL